MAERFLRSRTCALIFLGAVAVGAALGLRGRLDEVGAALSLTPVLGVLAALGLVTLGVSATAQVWLRLMDRLGAPASRTGGSAVFFVGQLGKYIPGSVWAIGAQAELARRVGVRPRSTVTAGLVFLGYNVATAAVVASVMVLTGQLETSVPLWVPALLLVGSLTALAPGLVNRLGARVAGRPLGVTGGDTAAVVGLLTVTWSAYGIALVVLTPDRPWGDLLAFSGAFAASYAVGVVVVFAPAGLGAREAVFVLLLAPVAGLGAATALAVLARVVHTLVDLGLAAGWSLAARREPARQHHPA